MPRSSRHPVPIHGPRHVVPLSIAAMLVLGGASGAESAAEPMADFRPGAWEITHRLIGGPADATPIVGRACFTLAQLQVDPLAPLRFQPAGRQDKRAPQCAISETRLQGGKLVMRGACKGPFGARPVAWTGTQGGEQFDLGGKINFGLMSVRMEIIGRHVGDCVRP
ncbi:MAG: hypothetical protein CFE37_08000 [Alphaproteobacteria bacterium PA4]|nr:MAG: hypothetical protein CFE37_08000 [Alphaproteobacteria bacterium PA4]